VLSLAIGHNGLDRLLPGRSIFGRRPQAANPIDQIGQAPSAQPAPAGQPPLPDYPGAGPFGFETGAPGPLRLFNQQLAGQISWTFPLAAFGLVAAGWQVRHPHVSDRAAQALVVWGMWFLTGVVFFSVANLFHPYYLVLLGPPLAALVGAGLVALWPDYRSQSARGWLLPTALAATIALQVRILADFPDWSVRLTPLLARLGVLATVTLIAARLRSGSRLSRVRVPGDDDRAANAAHRPDHVGRGLDQAERWTQRGAAVRQACCADGSWPSAGCAAGVAAGRTTGPGSPIGWTRPRWPASRGWPAFEGR